VSRVGNPPAIRAMGGKKNWRTIEVLAQAHRELLYKPARP
jgi:hypothetical protein